MINWDNAVIAPPSNYISSSTLMPITNLDPFDCNILPYPYNEQCRNTQLRFTDTVKPDCSRLPPSYQPFCRALPPPNPVTEQGNAPSYNPLIWPNTASSNPEDFARARQRCAQLGPEHFYSCLWKQTKYPWYGEFGELPPLINRDNYPCNLRDPITNVFSETGPMTGGWTEVSPLPSCSNPNQNQYARPKGVLSIPLDVIVTHILPRAFETIKDGCNMRLVCRKVHDLDDVVFWRVWVKKKVHDTVVFIMSSCSWKLPRHWKPILDNVMSFVHLLKHNQTHITTWNSYLTSLSDKRFIITYDNMCSVVVYCCHRQMACITDRALLVNLGDYDVEKHGIDDTFPPLTYVDLPPLEEDSEEYLMEDVD